MYVSNECDLRGCIFVFKQKTAYDVRISDWSSDVCSSDLRERAGVGQAVMGQIAAAAHHDPMRPAEIEARQPPRDDVVEGRTAGAHHDQIGRASFRERVCQYV